MADDKRQGGCGNDKVVNHDFERVMAEYIGDNCKKHRPSAHQVWIYVEESANLDMLLSVLSASFLFDDSKTQDMAVSAIDHGRVFCCSLPRDVAETKMEEVNHLCSNLGGAIVCVMQRSHTDVIRKA